MVVSRRKDGFQRNEKENEMVGAIVGYTESNNGNVTLDLLPCIVCGKSSQMVVSIKGFIAWQKDTFIQDAFPELKADEREMLMTGIHSSCFNQIFDEED